jgi:plastocyanin
MIVRALTSGGAVIFTLAALPALASAETRPIQAYDNTSHNHQWTPNALSAQQHDTIQWRLTQPGNPNEGSHDIWLIPPGGTQADATKLGATVTGPLATATVDQIGTYQFYCSIHGGLAPGAMNGTITVATDDPGAPIDPGTPWTSPDTSAPPPNPGGIPPAVNLTGAPSVFEQGDVTRPALTAVSVAAVRHGVRVRFSVSKGGEVSIRVMHGSKLVKRRSLRVSAGRKRVTLVDARRLKAGHYRVVVQATDFADLQSAPASARVTIKR